MCQQHQYHSVPANTKKEDLCYHENKERLTERQEIGTFLRREFLPRQKSSYVFENLFQPRYINCFMLHSDRDMARANKLKGRDQIQQ